jgi:hypothetical protein
MTGHIWAADDVPIGGRGPIRASAPAASADQVAEKKKPEIRLNLGLLN